MAAALPFAKLAGLLVKTLSKPVAKRIKHEFSRYPSTQRILVGIGQTTHVITTRMTIFSAGYKVRSITPLETEKAMSKGGDFLAECFVYFVSGSVVVYEYSRSKEKEEKKREAQVANSRAEREALQAKLDTLDARLVALEKVVKTNSSSILSFGEKYVAPEETVPIHDGPSKRRGGHGSNEVGVAANGSEEKQPDGGNQDVGAEQPPNQTSDFIGAAEARKYRWWGWWPF